MKEGGRLQDRVARMFQCAQALKRLAAQLHLCVVVINQVSGTNSDKGGASSTFGNIQSHSNGGSTSVQAALGASWHHCVTTRIQLEGGAGIPIPNIGVGDFNNIRSIDDRVATVVKSNCVDAPCSTKFTVTRLGLVDVGRTDDKNATAFQY